MAAILLVDDDDMIRHTVSFMLKRAGHGVQQAQNGKEALALMNSPAGAEINLVLTDLVMPEIEGVELVLRLRKLRPDLKIITMSGGGFSDPEAYLAPTRRLGAMATLSKPFSSTELLEAVRQVLDGT